MERSFGEAVMTVIYLKYESPTNLGLVREAKQPTKGLPTSANEHTITHKELGASIK